MISSEVQRTLVKSPPELWAELGDPASLARHLGELGDIRITRVDPEQAVEWEAEDTTGKVQLKPSGWGTTVTLTVTRETAKADTPPVTDQPAQGVESEPSVEAEHGPAARIEPGPAPQTESEPATQAQPTVLEREPTVLEPEPMVLAPVPPPPAGVPPATWSTTEEGQADAPAEMAETSDPDPDPELVPRRGLFARLFGRRPRQAPVQPQPAESGAGAGSLFEPAAAVEGVEPRPAEPSEPLALVEPEPAEPAAQVGPLAPAGPVAPAGQVAALESRAAERDEPVTETNEEPAESADARSQQISAELAEADEAATGEVTAVLTAVLDRLGAAHHRPFSRG